MAFAKVINHHLKWRAMMENVWGSRVAMITQISRETIVTLKTYANT